MGLLRHFKRFSKVLKVEEAPLLSLVRAFFVTVPFWFLANKMDLSTLPKRPILNGDEFLSPDDVEEQGNYIERMGGGYGWPLILIGLAVATVILSVYAL